MIICLNIEENRITKKMELNENEYKHNIIILLIVFMAALHKAREMETGNSFESFLLEHEAKSMPNG